MNPNPNPKPETPRDPPDTVRLSAVAVRCPTVAALLILALGIILVEPACLVGQSLPSPWTSQDINSATPPGDAVSTDGSTFTVRRGGYWAGTNPGESFHFAYRPIRGDGILTACLGDLSAGIAGVMMRETLSGSSRFAMTTVQPGYGVYGFWRAQPDAASAYTKGSAFTLPTWIKVVRQANLFSHYMSSNGINWSLIASNTLPMTKAIFVGLVACESSAGSSLATATFSNVTVNAEEGPPFLMVQPASQSRLERETALFTPIVLGGKPMFYQWYKGDLALPMTCASRVPPATPSKSPASSWPTAAATACM